MQHPETGEKHWSDLAEHIFSGFESRMAPILDDLKRTDAYQRVTDDPAAVIFIKELIQFLFWRAPANRQRLEKVVDLLSLPDLGIRFLDDKGSPVQEIEELMKTIDLWRRFAPALLAAGRAFALLRVRVHRIGIFSTRRTGIPS